MKYKLNKQEKMQIAIEIFGQEEAKRYIDTIIPLIDGFTRMKNHSYMSDKEAIRNSIGKLSSEEVGHILEETFKQWDIVESKSRGEN